MTDRIRSTVASFILLSLAALPLSAQYAAHVVVTGGSHAGSYDMQRPSCTIDGLSQVTMVDTSAAGRANRLVGLVVSPSKFALDFGRDTPGLVSPASASSTDASRVSGFGKLELTMAYGDITFQARFAGATVVGNDSVHVAATIGCKGVKRIP